MLTIPLLFSPGKDEFMRSERALYWWGLKFDCLRHYSKDDWPECAQCGERRLNYLELDHINNDGKEHRARLGVINSGQALYGKLYKQGYPDDGLQVLCGSCNVKKPRPQIRKRHIHVEYDIVEEYGSLSEQTLWEGQDG